MKNEYTKPTIQYCEIINCDLISTDSPTISWEWGDLTGEDK